MRQAPIFKESLKSTVVVIKRTAPLELRAIQIL